ncbi:hypothetical protein AVEN_191123-1 [Araneus ventricosus]|uniref:Uncharacterized protein n=1 Tax=Araneus ventricosus TaxID=182803 RepID=A0A4Y2AY37_ARAVE|nr:hypothetical protein AVEN_191123-1 [Araneus ventricosus]
MSLLHIVACLKMIKNTWFEPVPVEPAVNEIVSLDKITGLEMENYIDKLEEDLSPTAEHRRSYGVALCFTARSCGGEIVRGGGGGNSKATILLAQ